MTERKKVKKEVAIKKTEAISVHDALVEPMALGEVFMQSGMFKDIKTQAEAVVKIIAGKELGIAPIEAMSNIFIVNGKVAVMAKIVGSLIKKSEKYDYKIKELTDEGCILTFYALQEKGDPLPIGTSAFTKADAAKAGLINRETYKAYPKNMYFARALSNGAKWFTPDVYCGYTEGDEFETIKGEPETKTITMDDKGEVLTNGESNQA